MIEQIRPVVQKFAQYGLNESRESVELFHKWLDVWSFGLVGEIGEAYSVLQAGKYQEFKLELADICWYTIALELLLQDNALAKITLIPVKQTLDDPELKLLINALWFGLQYTEKVKSIGETTLKGV